jgi:mono/diheme cytochrome c family protein
MSRARMLCLTLVASAVLLVSLPVSAELLPAYQQKLDAIDQSLGKMPGLYRTHKYQEFGKLLENVEKEVDELKSGDQQDELAPHLATLQVRLEAAQRLLQSTLDAPVASVKKPAAKALAKNVPAKPKLPAAMAPTAGGISFTANVSPLLMSKCGRCHTQQPKGGFSVASYADIMKGSDGGTVFRPGKAQGSRLMELLESGEMPKGGGKFNPDELATISNWINANAPFDGADPTMPVTQMASNEITRATGSESVQFMRDVAPILVGHCTSCHAGEQGADNFELDTFARLKRGGRDGDVLAAGSPANSQLLKMIKGTAKDVMGKLRPQMPRRGPPLTSDEIAKIETWIAEGARFDGDDPNDSLQSGIDRIRANEMSHKDLTAWRDSLAKKNWALGNPDVQFELFEADNFRLLSDVTPARMKEITQIVESEQAKVSGLLKIPNTAPMFKGKLTLFVLDKRFEYTEFGRMVEKRELTPDMSGHSHYNVVDAYGAVLAPKEGDHSFPLLVAEQFAGAYVASLGKNVPRWFAVGSGRAIAAKIEPRSPLVKQWDEGVSMAMGSTKNPASFLNAKELDGSGSALAYGLVRFMMQGGSRHQQLIDAMRKGASFDQALMRTYGSNAQGLAAAWAR